MAEFAQHTYIYFFFNAAESVADKPTRKKYFFLWRVPVCADDAAYCELISKLTNSSIVDLSRLLRVNGITRVFWETLPKFNRKVQSIPIHLSISEDLSGQISRGCCLRLCGFRITKYYWGGHSSSVIFSVRSSYWESHSLPTSPAKIFGLPKEKTGSQPGPCLPSTSAQEQSVSPPG